MKKKKKSAKARPKAKAKGKSRKLKARASARPKKAKRAAKTAKRAPSAAKPMVIAPPNSTLLGRVEDYFAKIGVIALTLKSNVKVGDHLHILGHTTNLEQAVDSMQINHQPVSEARAKDSVGIKVTARVRRGDHVFLTNP